MHVSDKARDFIVASLIEDVASTIEMPDERRLGYIEGKLFAYLTLRAISGDEYEYFFDELVAAGLTMRAAY